MDLLQIGLIGHPLGHTMSPLIHRELFALSGKAYRYRVLDIPDISGHLESLRLLDGFNVTIPYKRQIISFLDELDPQAAAYGSVNTVQCGQGRMKGYTTDGLGCLRAVEDQGLGVQGNLLILGGGGAARALAFTLGMLPSVNSLTLACREQGREKAMGIQRALTAYLEETGAVCRLAVLDYKTLEEGNAQYDLLLNATSVGMSPYPGISPVSKGVLRRCGGVFDAVYNPTETLLLKQAKGLGIPTVGGMGMLVYQAAAAHEIWYGAAFPEAQIRGIVETAVRAMGERDTHQ